MRRLWNKQFIGCKESCLDGVVTLLPRLEMSMKKSIRKVFMTLLVLSFAIPSVAQGNSETGLWTSIEVEKKLDERFSVAGEAELRFHHNLRKADRWSVAGGVEYKLSEWLKVDAGYKFISSYNAAETKMKDNGKDILKRTASYGDSRHRLYASVAVRWMPLVSASRCANDGSTLAPVQPMLTVTTTMKTVGRQE